MERHLPASVGRRRKRPQWPRDLGRDALVNGMAQAVGCRITNLPGVHPNSSDGSGLPSNGPSGAYQRYSEQTVEPRRRPEFCSANQTQARVKGKAASHAISKASISDCAERHYNVESSDACLHETGGIDQAWPVRLKAITPSSFAKFPVAQPMHGGDTHSRQYRQRSDCLARRPIKKDGQIGPKRGCQPVQRFQRRVRGPNLNCTDKCLPKTGLRREVIL